ncbi:MAG TPA: fatty acid--CoA ligase family protein [Kofleriaceae bacterium]|nr:fatty acid--CoA ligase family protein [Kofleriaceae bacterium]
MFAAHQITLDDLLAVECVTSVPGALTVLYLMSRGFSFVLLPARDRTAPPPSVPRFCRQRLTVRGGLSADAAEISLLHPDTFLEISRVADHEPAPNLADRTIGHLFLRTSGSFGTPKLAVFTHDQLLANSVLSLARTRLTAHDRIALPVPLPHAYGLGAGFLPGFAAGASLRLIESANLLRYLEHERAYRPTVAFLTPTLCAMFSRHTSAQDHYRHIVVAGDKLKRELFEAAELRFSRVLNLYGTTEMGVIAVADAARTDGPRSATVGPPLPGVELRLDVPELAAEAPTGAGVIACRHPHGFEGYVEGDGRPWTGEPPLRDGWYRTRDLGRLHDGECLEVLGREDHSVNRDGRLVMLAEVERAMERLPGVERAITVVGRETLRGRDILAYCSPCDGHELEAARLRNACAGVLPAYAIPDQIVITSEIPLLANGKVDRRALATAAAAARPSRRPNEQGTM